MNQRVNFSYLMMRLSTLIAPLTAKCLYDHLVGLSAFLAVIVLIYYFHQYTLLAVTGTLLLGWFALNMRPSVAKKDISYQIRRWYYLAFLSVAWALYYPYFYLILIGILTLLFWLYEDLPIYQRSLKAFVNPILWGSAFAFLAIESAVLFLLNYIYASPFILIVISLLHITVYSHWYIILTREYYEAIMGGY
jgi:hypothetical protein